MEVEFADEELDRLEVEARFTGGHSQAVVKGFRKALQAIRAAHDERDLYAARGLRFEKLKGVRAHQASVRLNIQWRLILELKDSQSGRSVRIIGIEDYH